MRCGRRGTIECMTTATGPRRADARPTTMRAWHVRRPGPAATHPVDLETGPVPVPAPDELLVRVSVCGVCRTDLHLAEGDLPPAGPR